MEEDYVSEYDLAHISDRGRGTKTYNRFDIVYPSKFLKMDNDG